MQSSAFFNLEAKHFLSRKITEEKSLASDLLHLCNDSLESLRVVYSEVSENLTVNLDTSLVKSTHQLAVAHTIEASSSVDTLDPQCAECALLVTTIAISVGNEAGSRLALPPLIINFLVELLKKKNYAKISKSRCIKSKKNKNLEAH